MSVKNRVRDAIGEGIHTGLRKAADSESSMTAHRAIGRMDPDEWRAVLDFAVDGMETMGVFGHPVWGKAFWMKIQNDTDCNRCKARILAADGPVLTRKRLDNGAKNMFCRKCTLDFVDGEAS